MARLSEQEILEQINAVSGWSREGNAIKKQFTFPSFADAVAFVVRLGFAAEVVDHHPDILITYRRVTLSYSTHSEGGLTQKDFDGAKAVERFASAAAR